MPFSKTSVSVALPPRRLVYIDATSEFGGRTQVRFTARPWSAAFNGGRQRSKAATRHPLGVAPRVVNATGHLLGRACSHLVLIYFFVVTLLICSGVAFSAVGSAGGMSRGRDRGVCATSRRRSRSFASYHGAVARANSARRLSRDEA